MTKPDNPLIPGVAQSCQKMFMQLNAVSTQVMAEVSKSLGPMAAEGISQITASMLNVVSTQVMAEVSESLGQIAAENLSQARALMLNGASTRMMEKVSQSLGQIAVEVLSQIAASMPRIWEPLQQLLEEMGTDAQEMEPIFAQAGFWLSPSMPITVWAKAKSSRDAGKLQPAVIKQIILEAFREDNGALLNEMVGEWYDVEYFGRRRHIIDDALEAHLSGKYTLSVPALLPHVEGIGATILGTIPGSGKKIASEIKMIVQQDHSDLDAVGRDVAMEVLEQLYTWIDFAAFAMELQKRGVVEERSLHRHAILHGVEVDYGSEENSLKTFLLLDELHMLASEQEKATVSD